MARSRTFKTDICLSILDGDEHELALVLTYEVTPAFPGSQIDPPQPASAEITSVRLLQTKGAEELPVPEWLSDLIRADERLLDSLLDEAMEQDASDAWDAAERRAEGDRDDALAEGR